MGADPSSKTKECASLGFILKLLIYKQLQTFKPVSYGLRSTEEHGTVGKRVV